MLDAAGCKRGADGTRFRVTLKVSTDEQARLIGAALQEQWKKVGVTLEVRPLELATLFFRSGQEELSNFVFVGRSK